MNIKKNLGSLVDNDHLQAVEGQNNQEDISRNQCWSSVVWNEETWQEIKHSRNHTDRQLEKISLKNGNLR